LRVFHPINKRNFSIDSRIILIPIRSSVKRETLLA
jgi:hypothetical protein